MIGAHSERRPPPRSKTTLFCPGCDHESPIGGEWRIHERRDRVVHECPNCETAVTAR